MSVEDLVGQQQGWVSATVCPTGRLPQPVNGHVPPVPEVPLFQDGPEPEILADVVSTLRDRGREYGPPSDHHARTARAVEAILGVSLTPAEVALFFVIDKMVRRRTSPAKRDHFEDGIGYLAIAWGHEERGCE